MGQSRGKSIAILGTPGGEKFIRPGPAEDLLLGGSDWRLK